MRSLIFVLALFVTAPAFAQTPVTVKSSAAWEQCAASVAEAQALQYYWSIDGKRSTTPVLPIVCAAGPATQTCPTGHVPASCSTGLPAMTPGKHSLNLVAASGSGSSLVESTPSNNIDLLMLAVPLTPLNLRIQLVVGN